MGFDGDITMTNLKAATGIADDRLSAHHPNGTGNETAMGDFLVGGLGRDTDANPGTIESNLIRPHSVNGDEGDASGSFNANGVWSFSGDVTLDPASTNKFVLEIDLGFPLGEYFAEQIGTRAVHWNFAVQNCSVDAVKSFSTGGSLNDQLHLECTVTGFGSQVSVEARFGDNMNTDATNFNGSSTGTPRLLFQTADVQDATPLIAFSGKVIRFDDAGSSGSGHQFAVNIKNDGTAIPGSSILFDPNGQVDLASSTWELYKNGTSRGTRTQDPGFTFPFTEPEKGGGDTWKLTLHDQNNDFVDAVDWTWGDANAPFDNGGDPAVGLFERDNDDAAAGENAPEPCSITDYIADEPGSSLA